MKQFLTCIIIISIQWVNGQVLAAFSGTNNPEAIAQTNITANPLSRGPGLSVQNSSSFESKGWTSNPNSIDLGDYIEWTISADSDFILTITELTIAYDSDNKAPRNLELRTSMDAFSASLFNATITQNTPGILSIPLSLNSEPGESIIFRLYGYNSTNPNASRFAVTNALGNILGLANTGISIEGTKTFDGLYFDGSIWSPYPPDNTTGSDNAYMETGSFSIDANVDINDLIIAPEALLAVNSGGGLEVRGNLLSNGTLELRSVSNSYSSLIVDGSVLGDVVYKRHVNSTAVSGSSNANDLISPPVTGETFTAFLTNNENIVSNSTNTLYLFGPFDKSTGSYMTYSNTETTTLDPGVGYRAASTNAGTFTFTGTVNSGSISRSITYSGPAFEAWNLIGNPYPSYLKLAEFLLENNGAFDAASTGIYGYDGDASNGWTVWNLAYSDANPGALIAPGQGFLVASKIGGGIVTFNPSMRSLGNSDDFIPGRSATPDLLSYFKIKLTGANKSYFTEIYFNPNASLGLDSGYDAIVFGGIPSEFSIYSELVEGISALPLAVQAFNLNNLNSLIIPLGLNADPGELLSISMNDIDLPEETTVYLEDRELQTFTPILNNSYEFTTSTVINGTGRFYLHFESNLLSLTDTNLNSYKIYYDAINQTIVLEGLPIEPSQVNIYDVLGRLIKKTRLRQDSAKQTILGSTLNRGVYLVQIQNSKGISSKKLILR